jgi:hypothetical protein
MKTKMIKAIGAAALLCIVGCEYEAPLTEEHTLPIDTRFVGLWSSVPNPKAKDQDVERAAIVRFSPTEYVIDYPEQESGLYYRAYPIKVGGVDCVQLKALIHSSEGECDDAHYHVAKFEFIEGYFVVSLLNTKVVSTDLKTTEELSQSFIEHADHPELFKPFKKFQRCFIEKE